MDKRIPIITLTGSGRFVNLGNPLAVELERLGCIVFWIFISLYSTSTQGGFRRADKAMADMVYIHKIQLSDSMVVLDYENYIGESTEREICYAKTIRIPIFYISRIGNRPLTIYNLTVKSMLKEGKHND